MTASSMRAAAACALLATTCLVSPALAQSAPPPPYQSVDANGVDLVSGDFTFSLEEGSIGGGEGALSLVRFWAQDAGWTDNWTGGLYFKDESGVTSAYISLGATSDRFTQSSTGFSNVEENGATLVALADGRHRYTDGNGTSTLYRPTVGYTEGPNVSCPGAGEDTCSIPESITRPNGQTYTLSWYGDSFCVDFEANCSIIRARHRLRLVTSSAGYNFAIAYASDDPRDDRFLQKTTVTFGNDSNPCGASCPTVSYATNGNVLTVNARGREWRFTTGANGLERIKRPGASTDTTVISYGANGVSSVSSEGVTTSYARTTTDTTATTVVTDALGNSTTVLSDLTIGRTTQVTDALERTTTFGYDAAGRQTSVTAPEGNQQLTRYDARGNVVASTLREKLKIVENDINRAAGYEAGCANPATCNQPLWTRDAAGNQTDYTYNARGQVTSVTAPAPTPGAVRPQTRYRYADIAGVSMLTGVSACRTGAEDPTTPVKECEGSADEVVTTIAYDAATLQAVSVTTGAGDNTLIATTRMTYDKRGDLATVDGPLPGTADTTRIRTNTAREVVGVIGPDPDGPPTGSEGLLKHRAMRAAYNADGQVTIRETGTVANQGDEAWDAFASLEQMNVSYDANGRAVKQTLTAGGSPHAAVEYSYDALGRLDCTAQRMNPGSFGELTNACTQVDQNRFGTGAFGADRITRSIYDEMGRVKETRVAVGVEGSNKEGSIESASTFTPNGRLRTLTDGEGNRTTYEYDRHDRLLRTRYPVPAKGALASSETDYEEFGYDARSLVVSKRLRDGSVAGFGYDALGRMTLEDLPEPESDTTMTYDNLGRPMTIAKAGGPVSFAYDALGRMVLETGAQGAVSSQYDVAGRRTALTGPGGYSVAFSHLITGEMAQIREGGGFVLATFGYDDLGRRTSLTRGNNTSTSYAYDPVSRLQTLTQRRPGDVIELDLGFAYNPASQIKSNTRSNDAYGWTGAALGTTTSAANGLNQLVDVAGAVPQHDGRGNMTADNVGRSFGYSLANRLTSSSYPGLGTVTLGYDALGRLSHYNGGIGTRIAYDGADRIVEQDAAGNVLRTHVHGPGVDEPLVTYEGGVAANRRYHHADERGSIVALSDNAGSVVAVNTYDEYGLPAASNFGQFQYTGQVWMREIGIYHYKARGYHPWLGRFLQSDPVGYAAGLNLYGYVGGDPVNFTDPSGMCTYTWDNIYKGYRDGSLKYVGSENFVRHGCDGVGTEGGGGPQRFGGDDGGGGGGAIEEIVVTGQRRTMCPAGLYVARNGNSVSIRGLVQFRYGDYSPAGPTVAKLGAVPLSMQNTYVGMMNSVWSGPIGAFYVNTQLRLGAGGINVFIGNAGAGGRAELGGSTMWLWPLPSQLGAASAMHYRINTGHELGHIFGNDHPARGTDSGIMNAGANGRPLGTHIETLLNRCGL